MGNLLSTKHINFNSPVIDLALRYTSPIDSLSARIYHSSAVSKDGVVLDSLRAPSISIMSAERKRGAILKPNSLSAAYESYGSVCDQIINANVCEHILKGGTNHVRTIIITGCEIFRLFTTSSGLYSQGCTASCKALVKSSLAWNQSIVPSLKKALETRERMRAGNVLDKVSTRTHDPCSAVWRHDNFVFAERAIFN